MIGIYRTPNGVFAINPSVLFATAVDTTSANRPTLTGFDLNQPLPAGYVLATVRGASPINTPAFAGQVFFQNTAGQTGSLSRNFINGPVFFNWNASLFKNIRITERTRIQLRAEAFNVLNHTNLFLRGSSNGENSGIFNVNSNNFGLVDVFGDNGSPRILQFGARFEF
ncbi:MAG: hypothetical protein H0V88_00295 [Pyrinomonadaceae bacterium]|nr:hypothetical protein [Pyrinomonadaceae bacterium]